LTYLKGAGRSPVSLPPEAAPERVAKEVKMKRILLATTLLGAVALAGTARAQSNNPFDLSAAPVGKEAGTLMIRLRAIGVIPEDTTSDVNGFAATSVKTTATPAPEVDLSWFFTDNIAAELIAATTRHEISASGGALGSKLDVGSAWVLPPTLTVQYHFFPHGPISPYIGAGVNVSWFYNTQPARPVVTKFTLNNSWGPAIQAGVDWNFAGHWFANVDAKQIFLHTGAHLNTVIGSVKANTALDPLVVGAGIGYRF
jgi:outer membrane protein